MRRPFSTAELLLAVVSLAAVASLSFRFLSAQAAKPSSAPVTTGIPETAAPSVQRDRYRNFINNEYAARYNDSLRNLNNLHKSNNHVAAEGEAFFYKVGDGDPNAHARMAMQFLRASYNYITSGGNLGSLSESALQASQAYLWIRDSSALTAADKQFAQQYFLLFEKQHFLPSYLPLEYGAMNRSMNFATQREILTLLYPNALPSVLLPSADPFCRGDRSCYVQHVWDDWATEVDTYENSTHYNSTFLSALQLWLEAAQQIRSQDERQVYDKKAVRDFVYRFLAQASPIGVMPAYGDGVGLNEDPGEWIDLFEKWASIYRDGQFKWVTRQMITWNESHKSEMDRWGTVAAVAMFDLMKAYLHADPSIAEKRPTVGSGITYRHAVAFTESHDPAVYPLLEAPLIPDKLVLRSGWDPDDLYALVQLAPPLGHGHSDTGSIDLMTGHGSVLLGDTPYYVNEYQFHNAFQIAADGFQIPNEEYSNYIHYQNEQLSKMITTVPFFKEGIPAAYADVRISLYAGHPAVLNRRIFLVKNKLLWVQDRLSAMQSLNANVGPAWQTVTVDDQKGASWVNTRMTTIPVADLGGLKYLTEWTNVPCDLLVVFPKLGEGVVRIDNVKVDATRGIVNKDVLNTMNFRVWNQKHVELQPGTEVRFNSVLFPHAPGGDSQDLAGRFELVIDSPDASVLRFRDPSGTDSYIGINDQGKPVNTGPVRTRAPIFLVTAKGQQIRQSWYADVTD